MFFTQYQNRDNKLVSRLFLFDSIRQCFYFAALFGIIREHLGQLLQVVTGDAVGEDMHRVASFTHIEAGGLHAGGSIGANDIELRDSVFSNERAERFVRQSVTFCLHKDIIRNNLQFRRQLLATSAGFEGTGAGGDVVMLDIDDMHPLRHCPFDSSIDIVL